MKTVGETSELRSRTVARAVLLVCITLCSGMPFVAANAGQVAASPAPSPQRFLPRTGGPGSTIRPTPKRTATPSRPPALARTDGSAPAKTSTKTGATVGALAALAALGTGLAFRKRLVRRARATTTTKTREQRANDHDACMARWEASVGTGRAFHAQATRDLGATLAATRAAWSDAIASLTETTRLFDSLNGAPERDDAIVNSPSAVLRRILDGIADAASEHVS